MKNILKIAVCFFTLIQIFSCVDSAKKNITNTKKEISNLNAEDILGNPEYLAISYGGYRKNTRDIQPSIEELKEDMKILNAMGIRILRTYNVHLDQASNLLEAIHQLKIEDTDFEMYVMLGIWIDCKNAWTMGNW